MLLAVALLLFITSSLMFLDTVIGIRSMPRLTAFPPEMDLPYPSLAILFAARNEEKNIELAVRSLLKVDYPNLQVIAVNDRSTDATPLILEKLSKEFSHLKLIHIDTLPKGWLGKNHALFQGVKQCQSELLLFTDADIHFERTTLRRAVYCLVKEKWDHVTFIPQMKVPSFLLNLCVGVFGMLFFSYVRPWKAKDPKSSYFLGVGAFNLLKRTTYEQIGTFEAIRLRPDDDIKLGKLIKTKGFRQIVLNGKDFASVEWYSSVREFIKGLEKNMFAGADYRFFFLLASTFSLVLSFIVPYLAIFLTSGAAFSLFLGTIIVQTCGYIVGSKAVGTDSRTFIGMPLGILIYIYTLWNSIIKTLWNNGIVWRETFYSLEELKKNKV